MMRMSLHLNPLVAFQRIGGEDAVGLLAGAVAADLAGADGVVCRFDRHGFVTAQELAAVRSATSMHLTIELEPEDSLVMQALELKPDQVTFVPPFEAEPGIGVDLAMYAGEIKESVRSMHASGVDSCALIAPSVAMMKEARRLGFAFVAIDTSKLARASTPMETIEAFEEVESAALAASKLGLRVIGCGSLDNRNVGLLSGLGTFEEVVLDHRIYSRAFLLGLPKALSEVREAIQWYAPRGS